MGVAVCSYLTSQKFVVIGQHYCRSSGIIKEDRRVGDDKTGRCIYDRIPVSFGLRYHELDHEDRLHKDSCV